MEQKQHVSKRNADLFFDHAIPYHLDSTPIPFAARLQAEITPIGRWGNREVLGLQNCRYTPFPPLKFSQKRITPAPMEGGVLSESAFRGRMRLAHDIHQPH